MNGDTIDYHLAQIHTKMKRIYLLLSLLTGCLYMQAASITSETSEQKRTERRLTLPPSTVPSKLPHKKAEVPYICLPENMPVIPSG